MQPQRQTDAPAVGVHLTRRQIHDWLGGGLQDYLPHRNGRVICGCFVPILNPRSPDVVLPGASADIRHWAEVFAQQRWAVPVFLKRATNRWEYVGDYRVVRRCLEKAEIEQHAAQAGRPEVSQVLFLSRDVHQNR